MNPQNTKNMFIRHTYEDMWIEYQKNLDNNGSTSWDYVFLTAADEMQADIFNKQIAERIKQRRLPLNTHYVVLPDQDGTKMGSGGATFQILKYIAEKEDKLFENLRILTIHSGGYSKRVPQYSALGKLFMPMPRELPDGRYSTLFDEIFISVSSVPPRLLDGMLTFAGDVFFLFNPYQIDFQSSNAIAISTKKNVLLGNKHGVFIKNEKNIMLDFLHKQSEDILVSSGASDKSNEVDLDTGVYFFSSEILHALFSCISTENVFNYLKYENVVNEKCTLNFYNHFIYPMAQNAKWENYNGRMLKSCGKKIWDALKNFSLQVVTPTPTIFMHLGTSREVLKLWNDDTNKRKELNWKNKINVKNENNNYAAFNSDIEEKAKVGNISYIENSVILGNVVIGNQCIISNVYLQDVIIPDEIVLHGLKQKNGKYVIRVYGIDDNPKNDLFINIPLLDFIETYKLNENDIWDNQIQNLWNAKLFPECDTLEGSIRNVRTLINMIVGVASDEEVKEWYMNKRTSLYSSLENVDITETYNRREILEEEIKSKRFVNMLEANVDYRESLKIFGLKEISESLFRNIMNKTEMLNPFLKSKVLYALSNYLMTKKICLVGETYESLENKCFENIRCATLNAFYIEKAIIHNKILENEVIIRMPVRVNWGGGWTDTIPYCIENGGTVLNAAVKINGILPICVCIRRLENFYIEFESKDCAHSVRIYDTKGIISYKNDIFSIHKACLIACNIVHEKDILKDILYGLGGGIYVSTYAIGIPKGSGLGTSSILAAACISALNKFLGLNMNENEICHKVMLVEQMIGTGGGWQDQIGGMFPGIKYITSESGILQEPYINILNLKKNVKVELQNRFSLIYTGQRRMSRNLLRNVMGKYIGNESKINDHLYEIRKLAALMRFELERGSIDSFAELLSLHWNICKQLDPGISNTCIDYILDSCDDLIVGKFIAGAGGGGFLQVILKSGIEKNVLEERINTIFKNCGVKLWDCELLM